MNSRGYEVMTVATSITWLSPLRGCSLMSGACLHLGLQSAVLGPRKATISRWWVLVLASPSRDSSEPAAYDLCFTGQHVTIIPLQSRVQPVQAGVLFFQFQSFCG